MSQESEPKWKGAIKGTFKVIAVLFVAFIITGFLISILRPSNGEGDSDEAWYRYKQVDVNFDCISADEAEVTVKINAKLNYNLCWWVNYASAKDIDATLLSFRGGSSEDTAMSFLLEDNGADYEDSGCPPTDVCAYDEKKQMLYITPNSFGQSYGTRYTGPM